MNNHCPNDAHSKSLSAMDTAALLELLQMEQDSDKELDMELIHEVNTILNERTNAPPVDVDAAWDNFINIYAKSDYTCVDDDDDEEENVQEAPQKSRRRIWARPGFIAAALVVMLAVVTVGVIASNPQLRDGVVGWTGEVFRFDQSPTTSLSTSTENVAALAAVREALKDNGVTAQLVPRYIPEGYLASEVIIEPDNNLYSILFENTDAECITLIIRLTETSNRFETDIEKKDPYMAGNVNHYIATNMDSYRVQWLNAGYECTISGANDKEELKKIIDSIYSEEH